ncbi:hypothetical protein [Gordonia caeni]|uniref:Uncharacterized protein n=1 Tax=Gordonia caeni TaxID=1007097 RepID=A0ABP7PE17_9ACTN
MLTLALAATVVGFVLLVVALITGNFWLAVACIIVCVIGLAVLLVDTLRSGAKSGAGVDDEPLFTIRDRDSDPEKRSGPLLDGDEPAGSQETGGHEARPLVAGGRPESGAGVPVPENAGGPESGDTPQAGDDTSASGLGSLVAPGAVAPDTGENAPVTGDANDYIKSVTGSFPAQAPSGAWPASAEPIPPGPETAGDSRNRDTRSKDDGPDTGPIRAMSPYVGRRRRGVAPNADVPGQTGEHQAGGARAGEHQAGPSASPLDAETSPEDAGIEDAVVVSETTEAEAETEIGTEAGSSTETFVVRDHTGPLPKISFTDEDG